MKRLYTLVTIAFILMGGSLDVLSQTLTTTEYKKACWMTTRMYGGQRSGNGPNWLIMTHTPSTANMTSLQSSKGADPSQLQPGKCFTKDADGANSLVGGWVDCGDHVKFGQTMFYSAYTLLKGYDAFPHGYDDYYSYDYAGYVNSGDWTFEGNKGGPNGIPDILDELKYQCEFFIKCTPNASTFYSQVGEGDPDHLNWVTSVAMATLPKAQGGQKEGSRAVVKNPNDASMPSFCAATLALMSRVYKKFDPAFAATCLTHAQYAYTYAKAHPGTVGAGSFYPANKKWQDDYASACAELYWATGTASYRTEALSYAGNLENHNWCYNYNNNDDIAAYNLAKLGSASALTLFNSFASTYKAAVNGSGLYTGGDASWGPLRYNANAAFIVALHGAYNNETTVNAFVYKNVDYILGGNSSKFSFVVGFAPSGGTSAVHPHHRNVYLIDDIMADQKTMTIPTKNRQHGYMIGGSRTVPFTESATNYQTSEGGIDYNAGLVGAIAYIVSRVAAVDTNKFGHPTPNLGPDQSICGLSSIVLDSKIPTDTKKTYTWKKDGTTVVPASTTARTYTATTAGTYQCVIDSAGKWSTSDEIIITSVLPNVALGTDKNLCNPSWDTLKTAASGAGITYSWKKDNVTIPGATTSSYLVYNPGTYVCIISATGCTAKSDTIIVTSNLPQVKHDTICAAGTASLQVLTAGTYTWYDVLTAGTSLATGTTYSPNITASKTYYVQDASSMSASVGPTARMTTGSDWGVNANNHLKFTVGSSFTLNSLKVNYGTIYNNNASATITIEILDANGSPFTPAKTFTSNATNVTTAMSNTLIQFNFTNCNIDKAWGTNLRMRVSAHTTNGGLIFNTTGATYPYNSNPAGAVSITGTAGGDGDANDYMYFYDWRISAGSSCARTPVRAVIDPNGNCGDTQAPTTPGTITFSSITQSSFTATWTASTDNVAVTGYEVLLNGTLHSTVATNSISLTGLTCNTAYTVRVRAKDAAGNLSAYNTQASTTTTGVAAPTITNTTPTLCAGGTISLSIPTTTGATYAWTGPSSYTATTAAISRTSATTAMSGTYSATITVNGCTSTASTTSVTVNAIPAAPTVTSPVTYPQNATATPLTATGTGLKWYTTSTGGTGNTTAPTPNTTTVGTQIFYVSQTVNGCESPRSPISVDIVTATISQTISLAQGWNLISFNVVPSNTTIASVFAGVITQVNTVKNSDGFYKPGQDAQLQSLTNITVGAGYLVHMKTAQTLTVSGTAPGSVTVPLKAGWNMLGYPKSANGTTTSVLGATWTSAQIIKNFESFLDKTSGTLTTMKPGEGYYIYMNTASNVTF